MFSKNRHVGHTHRATYRPRTGIRARARNWPLQKVLCNEVARRFHRGRPCGVRDDRVAGASAIVLSRVWVRASGKLCRRECRACDAVVCAVGGYDKFLGFAIHSHLVAPFRIRGGCIRACGNGRGAVTHSRAAQIERKKPEQSHAPSALQPILLLTSDRARTGTRTASSNLAQACVLHALPNEQHRRSLSRTDCFADISGGRERVRQRTRVLPHLFFPLFPVVGRLVHCARILLGSLRLSNFEPVDCQTRTKYEVGSDQLSSEPKEFFCRAKAEKSLQRRGYVRRLGLAAHSSRDAGFSSFRNTKLGRAPRHTRDYYRFSDRSRYGVAIRSHAIRNYSNRGPVFRGPDRTPTPG